MTVTTGKWDLTGVHGLNRFIWSKLQSELGWSASNYGGLTPITVPQQQPEFNNYNAPYVVYNYSHQSTGEDFWMSEEQISYAVYSADEKDIRRFINLMKTYFERRDESAQMVNEYLRGRGEVRDTTNVVVVPAIAAAGSAENKRFDYKYTHVISTSGAQPAVTEGGRMDGLVILRIAYTYYDPSTGKDRFSL